MPLHSERSSEWRSVLALWLASRSVLWVVVLLAASLIPLFRGRPLLNYTHPRHPSPLFDSWARWDSEWYLAIAEGGYGLTLEDPLQRARYPYQPTAGFFPLYPWLIRVLTPLFGSGVAAGWWVSNLSLPVFLLLWHRMGRDDLGPAPALRAVAFFLCLPASLFCSAVYAESVFLLLSAACLLGLRRGSHGWAAAAAFGAALARPAGVFLTLPLAWEAWRSTRAPSPAASPEAGPRRPSAARALAWAAVLAPAAGIGVFAWVCGRTFGDPLAFVGRQDAWRGASGPPWRAFVRYVRDGPAVHGVHNSTIELVTTLAFLALLALGFRRMRRGEWAYCALAVLAPLCTSLFSFSRLALAAFPLLAVPAAWKEREGAFAALYLMVAVQSVYMVLFQGWAWVA